MTARIRSATVDDAATLAEFQGFRADGARRRDAFGPELRMMRGER